MTVLVIFIALVGAYLFGMVSALGAVRRISPAAYSVLAQELKWRKAERQAGRDKEGKQ